MKVTHDSGNNWSPMPATSLILDSGRFQFNVPNVAMQVHAVAFDPDVQGHILVGCEAAGVFESTDGGQTWAKVPFSDFFIRAISNFFFDRANTVVVATYGNGLWKLVPGELPSPILCHNPPARCWVDVRTLRGVTGFTGAACPRPPDLPTCQVYGVEGGVIAGLELSDDGTITRVALRGGELRAYDMHGKKIDPSLPVAAEKTTHPASSPAALPAPTSSTKVGRSPGSSSRRAGSRR